MPNLREIGALDPFDLKLLSLLESDARLTNAELGEKIGLSASQCSRRRARLEAEGFIEGYHARLSSARLGIGLRAFVQVSLSPHSNENARLFRELVNRIDEIQEVYALTGEADYLLKVVAADLQEFARIINDAILPHASVAHVRSSIVLDKLKDSYRLPLNADRPRL